MPGFSSYSQVVEPAGYVEPVSLDLLAKGTMYKEQMLEKNLEEVQSLMYNSENIPSLQGIDTEKKNEIVNKIKEQASQLSYSDLANPSVANQLKGYINSVTNSPDMRGIMQRGYSYETMLKEKKEAEAKDKQYFNYGLRQAQKYMEDGKYLRDVTFSNLGGIAPNEADILKKAKDLCEKKITRVKVGNQYELKTQYDPEDLAAAIKTVSSGYTNYNLYHKFQFDGTTEGTDWTEYANDHFNPIINTAKTNLGLANANYAKATKESDKAYYKKYVDYYSNQIDEYSKLINNPTATEEIKEKAFNDYQNDILDNQVSAMDAIQQGELKMDENTKMGIQFANELALVDRRAAYASNLEQQRAANDQNLAILRGDLKYDLNGTDPGILKADLLNLDKIINFLDPNPPKGNSPNSPTIPMTVKIGTNNRYYWTTEDIKNDEGILIDKAVKDQMEEPTGIDGEWYSVQGAGLLNKLNGTDSKSTSTLKFDPAGNLIPSTENTTGKIYKYLFKDKNSGKVVALVSENGREGWEPITNETVAPAINKGLFGNNPKMVGVLSSEVENFRNKYPGGGRVNVKGVAGVSPQQVVSKIDLKNNSQLIKEAVNKYIPQNELQSYLDKGYTTLEVAAKINERIQKDPNITAELLRVDVKNALI
jgi:hypothetical protein